MKNFLRSPWSLALASGPFFLGLGWLAGFMPGAVEAVYARGLYPWIARGLSGLWGWCPISLCEIGLYASPLVLIAYGIQRARKGDSGLRLAARCLHRLGALASVTVAAGMLLWGFNYRRLPFAAQAGWKDLVFQPSELVALAQELREDLVRLDGRVPRNPDGTLHLEDPGSLLRTAGEGFATLPPSWAVHHSPWARTKTLQLPSLLSLSLTYGVFAPWTGEAHVNNQIPTCAQPFSACHELVHQKGFAREDEANFIGWAAARAHPDPRFQYSATLAAFQAAFSRLPQAQRAELGQGLPPGVIADWQAERAFQQRHDSPVARASQGVYTGYLRSQGVEDGLRSYGRFLDLMLAQRRVEGRP